MTPKAMEAIETALALLFAAPAIAAYMAAACLAAAMDLALKENGEDER